MILKVMKYLERRWALPVNLHYPSVVLQIKTTTLMNKNIISFSFLFISEIYGRVRERERERESRRRLSLHTYRGWGLNLLWNFSTFLFIWYSGHPRKFSLSHFQPVAYTMHMITLPYSMPPNPQFTWYFRWKTCVLFTLGTRSIPCFYSQCPTSF